MAHFDPPELREELAMAVQTWLNLLKIDIDDFSDDIASILDPDLDTDNRDDDLLTVDSRFDFYLPKSEIHSRISFGDFFQLLEELQAAELVNETYCWTPKRLLVRVEPVTTEGYYLLEQAKPYYELEHDRLSYIQYSNLGGELKSLIREHMDSGQSLSTNTFQEQHSELLKARTSLMSTIDGVPEYYFVHSCKAEGRDWMCSLTKGLTLFGILTAVHGNYDSFFAPVDFSDVFVEVRGTSTLERGLAEAIYQAYLFELSSSLNMDFREAPRPLVIDDEIDEPHDSEADSARLRPLLLGKGMDELLRLYNRAISTSDLDVAILYFTKVFEYVSQTVIRKQATEAIRAKLLSPRALSPDADFIAELETVVEEQRIFKKDKEAIKQTVLTCCEPSELAKVAPTFLVDLRRITVASSKRDKETAMEKLAASIYSSRNAVAHAKANYNPSGEECPSTEEGDFVECLKIAAQQAIRWYNTESEFTRAT